MRELCELFVIFARIGGLTFGGGYAMLPVLEKDVVEKKQWITQEELLDYYAVAQCTPGIIASNTAALIGYKVKGAWGSLMASLGVVTPSYVIITLIAMFLSGFMDVVWVQHALSGVQACVAALILSSVVKLWKKSVVDRLTLGIFIVSAVLVVFGDVSPVIVIVGMAICGILAEKSHSKRKGE